MGCGSSGNTVVPEDSTNGHAGKVANGEKPGANGTNGTNGTKGTNGIANSHDDGLPTMVLPDTPVKPKPPIAFEIPLEEFSPAPRVCTPPPHLQRLMQPAQAEITLPDIEEKLAEAEQRRQAILQQRAASAQKKAQKVPRSFEMDTLHSDHESMDISKHNNLKLPPEPGVVEPKNIS